MNLENGEKISKLLIEKGKIIGDLKKWNKAIGYRIIETDLNIDSSTIFPDHASIDLALIPFKKLKPFAIKALTERMEEINRELKDL